jgi:predicted transcriptional regulator
MFEATKLYLQGFSAYKVSKKLNISPPAVYASLATAKQNFQEADKMLNELKSIGWPQKLPDTEAQTSSKKLVKKEAGFAFKIG